ncbi:hypothetical protein [Aeromonas phage Akh-2]|nr:hypothetical protein [Aeromonas phage Akh-2]
MAFTISKMEEIITLTAAKLRNLPAGLKFNSHMAWEYMKLIPQSTIVES